METELLSEIYAYLKEMASVTQRLTHCKGGFLDGTQPLQDAPHDNAQRWAKENKGWLPVMGWLVTDGQTFHKHEVVRGPNGQLYEVTPRDDARQFLEHYDDDRKAFDELPKRLPSI